MSDTSPGNLGIPNLIDAFQLRCLRLGIPEVTRLVGSKKLNIKTPTQLIGELSKFIVQYEVTLNATETEDRRKLLLGGSESKSIQAHLEHARIVAAHQKSHIQTIIAILREEFKDELQ